MKKGTVYQLRIDLIGLRPPVWRRLRLPADCTMDAAAEALLIVMSWGGHHLYAFRSANRYIDIPDPDAVDMPNGVLYRIEGRPDPEDAAQVKLGDFARVCDNFRFNYDFGDGWEHTVQVEKAEVIDPFTARKAVCLEGSRACPPDDCGGPHGYMALLDLLAGPPPEDEEAKARLAWLGKDWDAEAFDLESVNETLAKWKPDCHTDMYKACWDLD